MSSASLQLYIVGLGNGLVRFTPLFGDSTGWEHGTLLIEAFLVIGLGGKGLLASQQCCLFKIEDGRFGDFKWDSKHVLELYHILLNAQECAHMMPMYRI